MSLACAPLHAEDDPGLLMDRLRDLSPATDRFITFVTPGRAVQLSHAMLMEQAGRAAHYLSRLGLARGDTIGVCLPNCLEWVLLDLAALRLGVTVAGFEPGKFKPGPALMEKYGLRRLFAEAPAEGVTVADDIMRNIADEDGPAPPWCAYTAASGVALKFTSGSTGDAKALAATWGSIGASLAAVQILFGHGRHDRLFVFLPLSLLQQRYWVYSALLFGCDLAVTVPALALTQLAARAPSVVMGVPAFFDSLKQFIETQGDELDWPARARAITGPNIRYLWTGSAPCRQDVLDFFNLDCQMPLFEGYGMNETCIVTKNHPGAFRHGSAGRPVAGKQVWIGDDGVIRVRSRYPVNAAYRHAPPGASERVFEGADTVITGDLGRLDEDGFLWILGRADDVIVLMNGRNVHVRPYEERIAAVPGVARCIIAGHGRPYLAAILDLAPGCDAAQVTQAALAEANREAPAEARIGVAVIAGTPFAEHNGLLTSQGKPRRQAILTQHARLIAAAYEGA